MDSYYFTTPDIWTAAFYWGLGYALVSCDIDDAGRATWRFADGGEQGYADAQALLRSERVTVNPGAVRSGYYEVRNALNAAREAERV